MCDYQNLILNFLSSLVAVFVGAYAAFSLEKRRRKKEEDRKNIRTANMALYTISNLWNILTQYQKEVINPAQKTNLPWFNMRPIMSSHYGVTTFQINELGFLLDEDAKIVNVYSELLLEEQRFGVILKLIEKRCLLSSKEIGPALAQSGIQVGSQLTDDDFVRIVGIDVVEDLKQTTKDLIFNVEESLISLKKIHDKFRQAMLSIYPEEKFVVIQFDQEATS